MYVCMYMLLLRLPEAFFASLNLHVLLSIPPAPKSSIRQVLTLIFSIDSGACVSQRYSRASNNQLDRASPSNSQYMTFELENSGRKLLVCICRLETAASYPHITNVYHTTKTNDVSKKNKAPAEEYRMSPGFAD